MIVNGNSGTAATIRWASGDVQKLTLTGKCALTFVPPPGGQGKLELFLTQDATGSRTVTWPSSVKWAGSAAPTLSTTPGSTDIVSGLWDGANYWLKCDLKFG